MMESFQLNSGQLQQYQSPGYVRLENALPENLLARWRRIADELEAKASSEYDKGIQGKHYCIVEDPPGPRLMRYDDVHTLYPDAALDLLSCPAMLAISMQLCGLGVVPMQMDILYKQQHPHPVINWHQGAQHPRNHPYLNVGIYLDDAPAGDGCLRYVPDTQHCLEDIQTLSEKFGWEIPGVVEQPARAGDILIQDMMILHGSQPKRSPGTRRTIYVELRPLEGILESQKQSAYWADLRKQLMARVLARAENVPSQWRDFYPLDDKSLEALIKEMVAHPEPPIPAVWATYPVDHPDYPVPANLRVSTG